MTHDPRVDRSLAEQIAPNDAPPVPKASSRTLLRSTLVALVTAAVLTVCTVLPAEYGIDPTGIGSKLGLTQMGLLKLELAQEAALDARSDSLAVQQAPAEWARSPAGR